MNSKIKEKFSRIVAIMVMISVLVTLSGFNWTAAMSERDVDTKTKAEKDESVENLNVFKGANEDRSANNLPAVMSSEYPQHLELWGALVEGGGPESCFRARFIITRSGDSFKLVKGEFSDMGLHGQVPGKYTIYVIPKEEFAKGEIRDIYSLNKIPLVTFDTKTHVDDIDFSGLTDYTFESGDMLCFSPYLKGLPTFSFTGKQMVQDGYRTPPTHTGLDGRARVNSSYYWDDSPEDSVIALYEFTDSGIKEILNNPPQFNSFSSLYLQQGGAGKNESDLIKMGVKATDDRDENGILPSTNQSIDFTQHVAYNFLSGGNGLGSSKFDAATPSSWSVKYSVKDAWGSKTSAARNVFVFPDLKAKKVTMDAFTYQADGSIKINAASGEKIAESVGGYYVEFGDTTNNYVTKINTRAYDAKGGSLFDIIYGSDKKTFSVSSQGDANLPDGGVISTDKIKQIKVAKDRSVTIDTSYKNHAGKEVSVKVASTGEVIYPLELYVDGITFEDADLGEINIANFYFEKDLTKYLQAGQICKLKLTFWNPVPVNINEMSKTFKVKNFSVDSQWMDILSASGVGDAGTNGLEYHVPQKGNGEKILQEEWQFKALANSEKYIVTCEVALPEDFNVDIADYINSGLPLMTLEAEMTEADGSIIEKSQIMTTMAVSSNPIIEGKTILWSTKDGTSLGSDYARKNMIMARTYDNSKMSNLTEVSANNLKINEEIYKKYNFNSSNWEISSKGNFESLGDVKRGHPTIYSYNVAVKDSRREAMAYDDNHPLEAKGKSLMFAADKVASNTDKTKVLMANGEVPSITETKISKYGSDEDIINYILDQVSFEAVQVNGDTTIKDLNIGKEVSTTIEGSQDFSRSNPKPGKYTLYVYLSGEDKASGIDIPFEVKENTWSYDTPDRTEEDGASGYIVIPKYIELKSQEGNTIGTTEEVFFASYKNTTAKYGLSVDKAFEMKKTDNPESKFTVMASSAGGSDLKKGKWYIGEITNKNGRTNPLEVNFTAGRETVDKEKGRWTGMVTFYFERK